jgi:AcrR family transcriptional regulator
MRIFTRTIHPGSLYQSFPNKEALMAALIAQDQQARANNLQGRVARALLGYLRVDR